MERQEYKYFAFISYSAKDTKWGKRVQKKLEGYRLPSTLCSEHGWKRKPLTPIFFAPTDIQPGDLNAELKSRLDDSRNLIVICSPHSARSKWVGKEIEYFHSLGRTNNIQFFIVDGVPHSGNEETECFNPITETLGLPEILGANIHEKISRWSWINKERDYVQLITKLLGVEFDTIWQRHKRNLQHKCLFYTIFALCLMSLVTWLAVPINVEIDIADERHNLPPIEYGVINIANTEYRFNHLDTTLHAISLPGYMRGRKIDYKIIGYPGYDTLTQQIKLTGFHTQRFFLQMRRNHDYAIFSGQVFNEDLVPLEGVKITVENETTLTNADGCYHIEFPLERQSLHKEVNAELEGYQSCSFTSYATFDKLILRKH